MTNEERFGTHGNVCLRLRGSVVKRVVTEIRCKRTFTKNELVSNRRAKGAAAWKTLFPQKYCFCLTCSHKTA